MMIYFMENLKLKEKEKWFKLDISKKITNMEYYINIISLKVKCN